jgi:hypothetical protein
MGVLARIEDTTKGILRATARDTAGDILKAIMLGTTGGILPDTARESLMQKC